MQTRHYHGFTLIELLIVVAIIAILAAIAVPNFLEAQVRSKISASKADIRSVVTAMEAYRLDNTAYPPYACPDLARSALPLGGGDAQYLREWTGYTPVLLTTPVSYMTSIPKDKFAYAKSSYYGGRDNLLGLYHYESNTTAARGAGWEANCVSGCKYVLVGVGPDRITAISSYNNDPNYYHENIMDFQRKVRGSGFMRMWYDPTNGTVSDGDVAYHGPGFGFELSHFFEDGSYIP